MVDQSSQPSFGRRVTTESFYEGKPDLVRVEVEENALTTHDALLSDVIKCLSIIKQNPTPKLTIVVHMDKYGQPFRLTTSYVQSQKRLR